MRRILVLGSPGAGKSTFAKRLGARLELPVVHLDARFWRPGWETPPPEEWEATHRELVAADRWILDGNYTRTVDARLRAADAVILLDLPRRVCLYRVLKRWVRNYGRTRPDMAADCPEKVDREFLRYVWRFPTETLPRLERKFDRLDDATPVVRLRSSRECDAFLDRVATRGAPPRND